MNEKTGYFTQCIHVVGLCHYVFSVIFNTPSQHHHLMSTMLLSIFSTITMGQLSSLPSLIKTGRYDCNNASLYITPSHTPHSCLTINSTFSPLLPHFFFYHCNCRCSGVHIVGSKSKQALYELLSTSKYFVYLLVLSPSALLHKDTFALAVLEAVLLGVRCG